MDINHSFDVFLYRVIRNWFSFRFLRKKYQELDKNFEEFRENQILKEDMAIISIRRWDLDTSYKYAQQLNLLKQKYKEAVKNKTATKVLHQWTLNGNKKSGKKMTFDISRLMLSAYNGEADELITEVGWNNYESYGIRLDKVYERLSHLGEQLGISISLDYHQLKKQELNLVFQFREAKFKEKEEQKQLQEQIREEDKAKKEFERAQKKAEEDEDKFSIALEKARAQIISVSEIRKKVLEERIKSLEESLSIAIENKQRALSMAQQTRSGYVYYF